MGSFRQFHMHPNRSRHQSKLIVSSVIAHAKKRRVRSLLQVPVPCACQANIPAVVSSRNAIQGPVYNRDMRIVVTSPRCLASRQVPARVDRVVVSRQPAVEHGCPHPIVPVLHRVPCLLVGRGAPQRMFHVRRQFRNLGRVGIKHILHRKSYPRPRTTLVGESRNPCPCFLLDDKSVTTSTAGVNIHERWRTMERICGLIKPIDGHQRFRIATDALQCVFCDEVMHVCRRTIRQLDTHPHASPCGAVHDNTVAIHDDILRVVFCNTRHVLELHGIGRGDDPMRDGDTGVVQNIQRRIHFRGYDVPWHRRKHRSV
eukprot:m.1121035 g.1121035  ORF g.1121035 m.1121035 type:complete len:314 (-) comp24397_c1_seq42:1272-2213(-)